MQPIGRFLDGGVRHPHVHLCFDDRSVSNWHGARGILARHRAKAVFYVDGFHLLSSEEIGMLDDLRADGHVVGCHGKAHRDAVAYSRRYGIDRYIDDEIVPAMEEMIGAGFDPTHFAFPFTRFDDALFAEMERIFCFVRSGNAGTMWSGGRAIPLQGRADVGRIPIESAIRAGDLADAVETIRSGVEEGVSPVIIFHDVRPADAPAHAGTHARGYITPDELNTVLSAITHSGYSYETFRDRCEIPPDAED